METNVTAPVQPTATVNPAAARLNSAENAKAASKFLRTMLVLLIIVAVVVGVIIFTMGNKAEDPTVTQPTPTPVPTTPETEMTMEEYEAVVADVKSGTVDFTATSTTLTTSGKNSLKLAYDSDGGILVGEITESTWTSANQANPAYVGRAYEFRPDGKVYRSVNGSFIAGEFLGTDGVPDFSFEMSAKQALQSNFLGFEDYKTTKEAMWDTTPIYVKTLSQAEAKAALNQPSELVGEYDYATVQKIAMQAECQGMEADECIATYGGTNIWYFKEGKLSAYTINSWETEIIVAYSYEE